MNSIELKRALLADPTHVDSEQLRALQSDPELREYFNQALELDGLIHRAMQVDVPEDLDERLQTISCTPAKRSVRHLVQRPRWLLAGALAASLGLAMFSFHYFGFRDLSAEIVAHIQHEPASLMSDNAVDMRDVRTLLADYGMQLKGELGKVTYLTRCRVQGHAGVHMVLETGFGRVTVLLVPGLQTAEMTQIQGDGLEGYMISLKNRYSMAIVGQAGQPLMQVERLLRNAIALSGQA